MSNPSHHDSSPRAGAEFGVKLALIVLVVCFFGAPLLLERLITWARMPDWATWAASLVGVLVAVPLGLRARRRGGAVGVGYYLRAVALFYAVFLVVALLTVAVRAAVA
jgi:hypothetical protein